MLRRVREIADVAYHFGDVAQEKRAKARAARTTIGRWPAPEMELTRAVVVAGNAQVLGTAQIGAEFDLVIAFNLGPVVHKLILLFVLYEGTITAARAQADAKVGNRSHIGECW